jgi:small subunit ribosomal protein S8
MMTDPVADMLTRIRNGSRVERPAVDMPSTRFKARIADVLKQEGYIYDYQVGILDKDESGQPAFTVQPDARGAKAVLRVFLKYGPEGQKVIRRIDRASRPGRRLFRRHNEMRPVLDGQGIAIISTSRGVMSDRQARAQKLGGEFLCTVW